MNVGTNISYVITYIEKASGPVHDGVLTKMKNDFFSALPYDSVPATSSHDSQDNIQ